MNNATYNTAMQAQNAKYEATAELYERMDIKYTNGSNVHLEFPKNMVESLPVLQEVKAILSSELKEIFQKAVG